MILSQKNPAIRPKGITPITTDFIQNNPRLFITGLMSLYMSSNY